MRRVRTLRWVARGLAATALVVGLAIGWRWGSGNFGTVVRGEVYRSAQLGGDALSRTIRAHEIRTVLNLRGPNPDQDWYRAERSAAVDAGATLIDIPLASDHWLTTDQARTIVETLDTCDRPLLIHCQFGAERTGLVASIVELLRPGGSTRGASSQFSPYFLFLPIRDGAVMIGHLRQYEGWLDRRGLEHSPERFRRWLAEDYEPGTPNRSQWPYDPYPLRVVTRPGPARG